jgi:multiple sugar transport system substrate-binding protein
MKKLNRREFLKLAGLGSTAAILSACASQAEPTEEPMEEPEVEEAPPQPAKQVVTFTMYGHPDMVEEMVPLFNETHPNVEVQFERSEGQGYWEKLAAAIAAGDVWDCFRSDPVRSLEWGPKGVVLDVKPFLEADSTYPVGDYIPGIVDITNVEGKIYGIPTWCLTMWLFYNKNMFDEAGVDYPTDETTWDEYVEMTQKLTKRDGDNITQYGANGWDWWDFPVMQVVWSNGGQLYYCDDYETICVDSPETADALQDIADLAHVHQVAPNPLSPPTSPIGILNDNVATEGNGDYMPWDNKDAFLEKYDYLDAVQCPTRNGRRENIYWPDSFAINAETDVKEGAYQWSAWFGCDPESIAIQCKVVFPVTKKAYEDPDIAAKWLVSPRPPGMIASALKHSQAARIHKMTPEIGDLNGVYYGEIGRLWNKEATAEEVVADMQMLMDEIMAGE